MLSKLKILPRWIILSLDLAICAIAFGFSFLLSHGFRLDASQMDGLIKNLCITLMVNGAVFYLLKTYAGIIRYTGQYDALRILLAVFISSGILSILAFMRLEYLDTDDATNLLQLMVYTLMSIVALVFYRMLIKYVFAYFRNYNLRSKHVIIYGAGEAGLATHRVLQHEAQAKNQVLAFLDDDSRKAGKVIDGVKIHRAKALKSLAQKHKIDELIIATFTMPVAKRNALVELCLDLGIKVYNIPPFDKWINGEFSTRQLQSIKIENLLERDPIQISNDLIAQQIKDKTIVVTGAAGSIGSEIVKQLLKFHPAKIILCDQAETPLHELELKLAEINHQVECIPFLADVKNIARMEQLFHTFKPDNIYHAAAYKHVPMMERCPAEAVLTNVQGTKILADLAIAHGVERFVMVSTDKAVNPTNVMGASKRLAEIYVQSLANAGSQTRFITTRFGNVLGSNGSVINRFKEQIEKGGPLTVTHPEITRYFMTIPEACQLVLEAGSMGKGGEIFVFDMGQPITIAALAHKMVRLYGLTPGTDIKIEYTGLRPGEKLYEELLNDTENTIPTYHQKIMIAQIQDHQRNTLEQDFEELFSLAKQTRSRDMVAKMKSLVPEFLSKNSVFEELDDNLEKAELVNFKRVV